MLSHIRDLNIFAIKICVNIHKRKPILLFSCKLNFSSQSKVIHMPTPGTSSLETDEIRIETPYGHLAGKLWNKEGKRTPILACHGWLDNAGTWDNLIPYLDVNFPILAIDFPGHGLSSPQPLGFSGCFIDNLLPIERFIRHFKWKKVILLGHSMGGGVSMLYSGTFPAIVEKLIMFDILKPIHVDAVDQPEITSRSIQELFKVEERQNSKPPCYSYSEILEKTVTAYRQSLSEESAATLLKRGSKKNADDTYSYVHSPLLKIKNMLSMTIEQQKSYASKVKCDILLIKFDKAPIFGKREALREFLYIYRNNCANFIFEIVRGTHHAHLNSPESVAPIVNDFLNDLPQDKERKLTSDKFIELTF